MICFALSEINIIAIIKKISPSLQRRAASQKPKQLKYAPSLWSLCLLILWNNLENHTGHSSVKSLNHWALYGLKH